MDKLKTIELRQPLMAQEPSKDLDQTLIRLHCLHKDTMETLYSNILYKSKILYNVSCTSLAWI